MQEKIRQADASVFRQVSFMWLPFVVILSDIISGRNSDAAFFAYEEFVCSYG